MVHKNVCFLLYILEQMWLYQLLLCCGISYLHMVVPFGLSFAKCLYLSHGHLCHKYVVMKHLELYKPNYIFLNVHSELEVHF